MKIRGNNSNNVQEKIGKILSRVNTIVKPLKREKGSCEEIF